MKPFQSVVAYICHYESDLNRTYFLVACESCDEILTLLSREVGNNSKHITCIWQVRDQLYTRVDATKYSLHKER